MGFGCNSVEVFITTVDFLAPSQVCRIKSLGRGAWEFVLNKLSRECQFSP